MKKSILVLGAVMALTFSSCKKEVKTTEIVNDTTHVEVAPAPTTIETVDSTTVIDSVK